MSVYGRYSVDGVELGPVEVGLHLGALNAALSGLFAYFGAEGSEKSLAYIAFSNADAVVREFRKRTPDKEEPEATALPAGYSYGGDAYRLVDDDGLIEAFVAGVTFAHSGARSVVRNMRNLGRPVVLDHQILQWWGATLEDISYLVSHDLIENIEEKTIGQ